MARGAAARALLFLAAVEFAAVPTQQVFVTSLCARLSAQPRGGPPQATASVRSGSAEECNPSEACTRRTLQGPLRPGDGMRLPGGGSCGAVETSGGDAVHGGLRLRGGAGGKKGGRRGKPSSTGGDGERTKKKRRSKGGDVLSFCPRHPTVKPEPLSRRLSWTPPNPVPPLGLNSCSATRLPARLKHACRAPAGVTAHVSQQDVHPSFRGGNDAGGALAARQAS